MKVQLHAFLNSAPDGDEWSASRPGRFNLRERDPGTHWIAGYSEISGQVQFLFGLQLQNTILSSDLIQTVALVVK
jgi:hypothetical protein